MASLGDSVGLGKRIQNIDELVSHGNMTGRKAILEILETGLQAADPYNNTRKLIRLQGDTLIVGGKEFEPSGSPITGEEVYDLSDINRIFVLGAGKGIQRVAKAIEDTLGDRLTGGHVIDKKGSAVILKKIGVTLGAHPLPDEDCARGCERIRKLTAGLTENDLVFTCVSNGVSSLLTMPAPGVSIEDLRKAVYTTQIELGSQTRGLYLIRNQVDMMKGGRISRLIQPAKAIHIIAIEPGSYDQLMHRNGWLHTLPDENTTYERALKNLKEWNTWDNLPESIKKFLETSDPKYAPVRSDEFEKWTFRIFGVMPGFNQSAKLPPAIKKARELGFNPVILSDDMMQVEAAPAGRYMANITRTIERTGKPFEPPCAIFSSGEMIVTVGQEKGIGGRSQEYTLSAALRIAGSKRVVMASVDTDGTDGPGTQFANGPEGMPPCFAGGVVDGYTVEEAEKAGVENVLAELRKHNTSPVLWKAKSAVVARQGISLNDLTVALVMGHSR